MKRAPPLTENLPARSSGPHAAAWSSFRIGLALASLAFTARASHLWESSDYPAFWAPIVDADRYDALARALARGSDPALDLHWQAPFYPLFLSLVYRLAPAALAASLLAAKLVQAALGTLTAIVSWRLAARFLGERRGALAGVMLALYAPALFYESELLGTGFEMFWAASLPWLMLRHEEQPRLARGLLLGVAFALAIATRATFLPFVGGAGVWLLLRASARPEAHKSLCAVVAALALTLAPQLWHRAASGGDISLLPLSSGVNLFIGNNAERCRTLAARPGAEWQAIVDRAEQAGAGASPVLQDEHFRMQFARYAADATGSWLRGVAAKLGQLASGRELPRNDDLYTAGRWSLWLRAQLSPLGLPFALLVALAAASGFSLPRGRARFPLLWMIATQAMALALVFVSSRHRMVLVPPLAVLAAVGAFALSQRGTRRPLAVAGFSAALGVSLLLPDPCGQTRLSEADLHRAVAHRHLSLEQLGEAGAAFESALHHEPDAAETLLAAFYARLAAGQPREALPHIERYVRLRPDDANGRRLLEGTRALVPPR